jgi:hypothetical protein
MKTKYAAIILSTGITIGILSFPILSTINSRHAREQARAEKAENVKRADLANQSERDLAKREEMKQAYAKSQAHAAKLAKEKKDQEMSDAREELKNPRPAPARTVKPSLSEDEQLALIGSFRSNEVRFKTLYAGKSVKIEGEIVDISSGFLGNTVTLENFAGRWLCYFKSAGSLNLISKGMKISITGTLNGAGFESILGPNATLVLTSSDISY